MGTQSDLSSSPGLFRGSRAPVKCELLEGQGYVLCTLVCPNLSTVPRNEYKELCLSYQYRQAVMECELVKEQDRVCPVDGRYVRASSCIIICLALDKPLQPCALPSQQTKRHLKVGTASLSAETCTGLST